MKRRKIAIGLPIVTNNKTNKRNGDDYIMAIKLEMNGATFTFETTEEYEAFTKLHNEAGEVEAAKEDSKEETLYMIKSEYVDTDNPEADFKDGADRMLLVKTGEDVTGIMALVFDVEVKAVDAYGEHEEGDVIGSLVAVNDEHLYEVTREEFEAKKAAYLAEKDALKVGDLIAGNELSERYTITTDRALMRVISVNASGESMRVEVIKHVSRPKCDWHGYDVGTKEFVKTTEEEFDAKHGITKQEETDKDANVPEGYEKVSFADAKEGDYFLALEDGMDILAGEMYVLSEGCEGRLEFFDDMADERNLSWRDEDKDGIVIRKIAEEDTQEEPVKALKIEAGDVVRTKRKYTDVFGDSIKDNRLAVVLEVRPSGVITVKQRSGKDYVIINAEDVESTLELVAKAIK